MRFFYQALQTLALEIIGFKATKSRNWSAGLHNTDFHHHLCRPQMLLYILNTHTHTRARMQTTSPDHSKCIAGQRSVAAQGRPAEESHTFTPPEIITICFHLSRVYSARRPPLAAFPTVHSVASKHNSTIVNALTRLCCSVALMKLADRGL